MTTQLSLYNGALRKLKERRLTSLDEPQERRRALDGAWEGRIRACLEQGLWKFARRTVELEKNPSFTPTFGYQNQFEKPVDFVRTVGVWQDEYCRLPLTDHINEGGFWYADADVIYLGYISEAPEFGGDVSLWPESFIEYVEWSLASSVVGRLKQGDENEIARVQRETKDALREARSLCAMEGPTVMPPRGSWTRARSAGRLHGRGYK